MTTHLSTRLVWHDRAWDGHVCDHPSKNAYCIVQQHIRDGRDDDREDKAAGLPLADLDGWQPPCSRDPIAFSKVKPSTCKKLIAKVVEQEEKYWTEDAQLYEHDFDEISEDAE